MCRCCQGYFEEYIGIIHTTHYREKKYGKKEENR